MNKNYYRPDIDGLRAFAVTSVILFHLDFEFASGGFIGVDVFFVISGFLITGIIKKEIERSGKFNYTNFYVHRIRRIFPALFVTILLSTIFSILLFSPSHLEQAGGSIIHALSGLSNFYFWTEAGYFDSATEVKPLLHTWSLGIEEQFYFLWPFLFSFIIKTKNKFLLVLTFTGMMVVSLFLNYQFQDGYVSVIHKFSTYTADLISDGRSTIFYLLPFRLYEFAIGGILVFATTYTFNSRVVNEIIMVIGISLVIYPFLMFSEQTLFPSYNALFPCIGSAFIIYSGNKSKYLGRLFSNKVTVDIGLISYSLYLVHWPIIVFWKYYTFENISSTEAVLIIIVSIFIAKLMYKYIEQPFRVKKAPNNNNTIVATSGVAALFLCSLIVVISSNLWKNKGWPWRVNTVVSQDLIPPKVEGSILKKMTNETKWTFASTIGDTKKARTNILVIGDSHAEHLKGAAKYLSKKYNLFFTFYTFQGCPPIFGTYKVYNAHSGGINNEVPRQIKCRDQTELWEKYVSTNKFDYVILSSRWNWLFEPRKYYDTEQDRDLLIDKSNRKFTVNDSKKVFSLFLDHTVRAIHATGAKAIIFGQVPLEGKDLNGCNNVPRIFLSENNLNKRCRHVPKTFALKRSEFSNKTIKHIASVNNAITVFPTDMFCEENNDFCKTIHNGTRLKDDDDHINDYGSVYLARQWELSTDFPFIQI